MGIPGFNTWFYANNKQAYQTLQHTQTDHLYIDMNSVLHNVLRKGEVSTAAIKRTAKGSIIHPCMHTDELLPPTHCVMPCS